MPSVSERSDRKQEFIDVALELFYQKGYDKTTINDIITEMGVSKGAFYHYFSSKEDVIETISKDYSDKVVNLVKNILTKKDASTLDKLNQGIALVQDFKKQHSKKRSAIKKLYSGEQNLKLKKKMEVKVNERLIPYYCKMFEEGNARGEIDVINPKEMTLFLLAAIRFLNETLEELSEQYYDLKVINKEEFLEAISNKLEFYEIMLERVLGLNRGALNFKEPYLKRF